NIQMMVLAKIKTMFERFDVRVPLAEAYKLHDLDTLALIENRTYEEDVEVVSGYIAYSNKWNL
ncbi:GTPase HflX, partial [Streptococcus suis]